MNNPMQILQMISNLQQNPMQILRQAGLNIPNGINSPQDIIQHLLNSGQITQEQVNQAQQMQRSPMFANLFNRK